MTCGLSRIGPPFQFRHHKKPVLDGFLKLDLQGKLDSDRTALFLRMSCQKPSLVIVASVMFIFVAKKYWDSRNDQSCVVGIPLFLSRHCSKAHHHYAT